MLRNSQLPNVSNIKLIVSYCHRRLFLWITRLELLQIQDLPSYTLTLVAIRKLTAKCQTMLPTLNWVYCFYLLTLASYRVNFVNQLKRRVFKLINDCFVSVWFTFTLLPRFSIIIVWSISYREIRSYCLLSRSENIWNCRLLIYRVVTILLLHLSFFQRFIP